MTEIKKKIQQTIDKADSEDHISRSFDLFIIGLIILNVLAIIFETVEDFANRYAKFFEYFELFSVIIFTIEYMIRIWVCTTNIRYASPVWGRIKYVFSTGALIDLIAILPFYLPLLIPMDTMLIRMLRLFRLLRVFKLGRYFEAYQLVSRAVTKRKEELIIVLSLLGVLLVLASSLMFYIEHEAQPEVFTSIPATMWWAVATLTTVGYGDVYPITVLGKMLGACIAILGIGVFALPAGIIAASFESELSKRRRQTDNSDDTKS